MDTKTVLVTYATRFGSTQEVAEKITVVLRDAGFEVELRPIQEVEGLDAYEAVVLGAALYNARWHSDAHQFIAQHQSDLKLRPMAIFALGPLGTSNAAMQRSRSQLDRELAKYSWLKPVALEMFPGKYDPTKPGLGFLYRLLPIRDYRNWEAIDAWAKALPVKLKRVHILQRG